MSWQVGLLLYYVALVSLTLVQRSYSLKSKLPESFPPALSYLLGVMPMSIVVGLVLRHHIHWSLWLGCLLVIEGAFIGLYNWLSFKAVRLLPVARFQTIYQSYEIVVIALGWILLGERLNAFQVIGGVLLICAALIAVRAPIHKYKALSRETNKKAISLTLLSALVMGIGLIAEKAALHYMDIGAYFIFGFFTQTVATTALAAKDINRHSLRSLRVSDIQRTVTMGGLCALCGFFYILAITKSNNISLITALGAFTLPLIMLSSYVILHERENVALLWSATALGCIGIIVSALH